jgi:hypothetical protein
VGAAQGAGSFEFSLTSGTLSAGVAGALQAYLILAQSRQTAEQVATVFAANGASMDASAKNASVPYPTANASVLASSLNLRATKFWDGTLWTAVSPTVPPAGTLHAYLLVRDSSGNSSVGSVGFGAPLTVRERTPPVVSNFAVKQNASSYTFSVDSSAGKTTISDGFAGPLMVYFFLSSVDIADPVAFAAQRKGDPDMLGTINENVTYASPPNAMAAPVLTADSYRTGASTWVVLNADTPKSLSSLKAYLVVRDNAGNSTFASATAAVADVDPPSYVGVTATASNVGANGFTVSWNAFTDNVAVATYEVYRSAGSVFDLGSSTKVGNDLSAGTLTVDITGISTGQTYYAYVRAKDAAGNVSLPARAGPVTTVDPSPPTISAITASAANTTISLASGTASSPTPGTLRFYHVAALSSVANMDAAAVMSAIATATRKPTGASAAGTNDGDVATYSSYANVVSSGNLYLHDNYGGTSLPFGTQQVTSATATLSGVTYTISCSTLPLYGSGIGAVFGRQFTNGGPRFADTYVINSSAADLNVLKPLRNEHMTGTRLTTTNLGTINGEWVQVASTAPAVYTRYGFGTGISDIENYGKWSVVARATGATSFTVLDRRQFSTAPVGTAGSFPEFPMATASGEFNEYRFILEAIIGKSQGTALFYNVWFGATPNYGDATVTSYAAGATVSLAGLALKTSRIFAGGGVFRPLVAGESAHSYVVAEDFNGRRSIAKTAAATATAVQQTVVALNIPNQVDTSLTLLQYINTYYPFDNGSTGNWLLESSTGFLTNNNSYSFNLGSKPVQIFDFIEIEMSYKIAGIASANNKRDEIGISILDSTTGKATWYIDYEGTKESYATLHRPTVSPVDSIEVVNSPEFSSKCTDWHRIKVHISASGLVTYTAVNESTGAEVGRRTIQSNGILGPVGARFIFLGSEGPPSVPRSIKNVSIKTGMPPIPVPNAAIIASSVWTGLSPLKFSLNGLVELVSYRFTKTQLLGGSATSHYWILASTSQLFMGTDSGQPGNPGGDSNWQYSDSGVPDWMRVNIIHHAYAKGLRFADDLFYNGFVALPTPVNKYVELPDFETSTVTISSVYGATDTAAMQNVFTNSTARTLVMWLDNFGKNSNEINYGGIQAGTLNFQVRTYADRHMQVMDSGNTVLHYAGPGIRYNANTDMINLFVAFTKSVDGTIRAYSNITGDAGTGPPLESPLTKNIGHLIQESLFSSTPVPSTILDFGSFGNTNFLIKNQAHWKDLMVFPQALSLPYIQALYDRPRHVVDMHGANLTRVGNVVSKSGRSETRVGSPVYMHGKAYFEFDADNMSTDGDNCWGLAETTKLPLTSYFGSEISGTRAMSASHMSYATATWFAYKNIQQTRTVLTTDATTVRRTYCLAVDYTTGHAWWGIDGYFGGYNPVTRVAVNGRNAQIDPTLDSTTPNPTTPDVDVRRMRYAVIRPYQASVKLYLKSSYAHTPAGFKPFYTYDNTSPTV